MKALIVEDDRSLSNSLHTALKRTFDFVEIAEEGFEAIVLAWEQLRTGTPYAFICLDIIVPNRNGRQILRTIRDMEDSLDIEESIRSKIIMTTGLDDPNTVEASFHERCDAYLVKPLSLHNLNEQLAKFGFDT